MHYLRYFETDEEFQEVYVPSGTTYVEPWVSLTVENNEVNYNKKYIQFEDPEVERICMANFSRDGIGVTYEDAAAVTSLGTVFKGNTSIISFDELVYFTNIVLATRTGAWYDGNEFGQCTNLQHITLPTHLTRTGWFTFTQCTSLQNIVINEGITGIGNGAFYMCSSLTKIELPTTLVNLDGFTSCTGVTQIISKPQVPPIVATQMSLYNLRSLAVIYVPYSADHSILASYQSATYWSEYASKMAELNPDGTIPSA